MVTSHLTLSNTTVLVNLPQKSKETDFSEKSLQYSFVIEYSLCVMVSLLLFCCCICFVIVGVDSDEPDQRTEAGPVQRVSVLLRAAGVDWSPGSQSPGWSISHKAARSGPAGGGVPQVDT